MFSLYHHRANLGPFYFVIDFSVIAFGPWIFIDPDKSIAVEFSFFCWSIGVNLFNPVEEGMEVE